MSLTANAINLDRFTARASTALATAVRHAHLAGSNVVDSRYLLRGLMADTALWPPAAQAFVREFGERRLGMATEALGKLTLDGTTFSREVEVILGYAHELSAGQLGTDAPVHSEHLLLALMDATGNEATIEARAVRGQHNPWADIRPYVHGRVMLLMREEEKSAPRFVRAGTADDRVTALLYILLRDTVPYGVLEARVREFEKASGREFAFEDGRLLDIARSYTARLLG